MTYVDDKRFKFVLISILPLYNKTMLRVFQDVGIYGPLKVREVIAFDKLRKQADILAKIYCLATSKKEIVFDGKNLYFLR